MIVTGRVIGRGQQSNATCRGRCRRSTRRQMQEKSIKSHMKRCARWISTRRVITPHLRLGFPFLLVSPCALVGDSRPSSSNSSSSRGTLMVLSKLRSCPWSRRTSCAAASPAAGRCRRWEHLACSCGLLPPGAPIQAGGGRCPRVAGRDTKVPSSPMQKECRGQCSGASCCSS